MRSNRKPAARKAVIDSLEQRLMMYGSTFNNGTLTVTGGFVNQIIVNYNNVQSNPSEFGMDVQVGNVDQQFSGQLENVVINAGDEPSLSRLIQVNSHVNGGFDPVHVTINGGNGTEQIITNITTDNAGVNLLINAGTGTDTITANFDGHATINGGAGNDSITAGTSQSGLPANAVINGNGGNDTITASGGTDAIFGGAGDDTIHAQDGNYDYIDGGTGFNTAYVDSQDTSINIQSTNPAAPYGVGGGTVIGTSGSWHNDGNNIYKVFDNNLSTFFDAPTANGDWVGTDLSFPTTITQISYAPRPGFAGRMVGGIFQASNSPTFSSGVLNLYTITAAPEQGVLTTVTPTNYGAYRYVRYLSPNGGYGNVAELKFMGDIPIEQQTGTVIGTTGSYQNQGNAIANVFDGNVNTFFDAPTSTGSWVGIDFGGTQTISAVRYAPRAGWTSRMVGGEIQASNSADFSSGVVTMLTITANPNPGELTTQSISNLTPYRYWRYIGPAGSFCNIAELQFLS
jgi:hypothetical protein